MPGFGSFCPSLRISFAKTAFTRVNAHQLIAAPPWQVWFNHCRGGAAPFLVVVFTQTPPAREAVDSRAELAPPSVGTGLFQKKAAVQKKRPQLRRLRSTGVVLCRGSPIPMPPRHVPKLKSDSSRCL